MLGTLALLVELLYDAVTIALAVPGFMLLRQTGRMASGTFGATYEPYNAYANACAGLLSGASLALLISVVLYMLVPRWVNTLWRARLRAEPLNGGTRPGASTPTHAVFRMRRMNRWFVLWQGALLLCVLAGTVLGAPALRRYRAHPNFYLWLRPAPPSSSRMLRVYIAEGAVGGRTVAALAAAVGLGAAHILLALVRWPLWSLADRTVDVERPGSEPRPACVEETCFVPSLKAYRGYLYSIPPVEADGPCEECGVHFVPPVLRKWYSPPYRQREPSELQPRLWTFGCGHTFHPPCLQRGFADGNMHCPSCLFGREEEKGAYAPEKGGCAGEKAAYADEKGDGASPVVGYMV